MLKQVVFLIMSIFLIGILSAECINLVEEIDKNDEIVGDYYLVDDGQGNYYYRFESFILDIQDYNLTYTINSTTDNYIRGTYPNHGQELINIPYSKTPITVVLNVVGEPNGNNIIEVYANGEYVNYMQFPQAIDDTRIEIGDISSSNYSDIKKCKEEIIIPEEILDELPNTNNTETPEPEEPKKRRSSGGGSSKEPEVIEIIEVIEVEPIEVTERKLELERIKKELEVLDRNIFVKFWEWLRSIFN